MALLDSSFSLGRLGANYSHDLLIKIEGMTLEEYKNKGEGLSINYNFATTFFGNICIASTAKGICHLSFADSESEGLSELGKSFPNAKFYKKTDAIQQNALRIFDHDKSNLRKIKLHLKGTEFQIKVWESLLKIPMGKLTTYGEIAKKIENQKASRAVGSAIGDNSVAFLIPCHRVIQASGELGKYRWGADRKAAMIGWEAAPNQERNNSL